MQPDETLLLRDILNEIRGLRKDLTGTETCELCGADRIFDMTLHMKAKHQGLPEFTA